MPLLKGAPRLLGICVAAGVWTACIEDLPSPDVEPTRASTRTPVEGWDVGNEEADVGIVGPFDSMPPADVSWIVPEEDCASYTRAECLASVACTLRPDGQFLIYRCDPAVGACEIGMRQGDAAACRARSGCVFLEAMCYCPCRGFGRTAVPDGDDVEDCECACAAGEPARCVAEAMATQG